MAERKITYPSVYILHDSRRETKEGKKPLRLVVKANGKMKVWGLNAYMTDFEYTQIQKTNITSKIPETKRNELQSIKVTVETLLGRAKLLVKEIVPFTFEEFEKAMFEVKVGTLFIALQKRYDDLLNEGRAGNASSYMCTLNALKMYRGGIKVREGFKVNTIGGQDISLTEVNVTFLKSFEKWFTKTGNSTTSVGIYMRNIRVVINQAIEQGIIKDSPFGKNKYLIPKASGRKLALTIDIIAKIQRAEIIDPALEKYRDYWLFLYYCGGMNPKDMARLKYQNIDVDEISYVRAKTAYKKSGKQIVVPLIIQAAKIIDKWGTKPYSPSAYVFPILEEGINPLKERRTVVDETAKINRAIKKVATILEIESNISTYTARHSFATILKRSGVPVSAISDHLGHSDTKTTENYLAGFEKNAVKLQWSNLLPAEE